VINGAEDPWIKPEDALRLTNFLPEGELILFSFCGHMPQEEKPNEVARKLEKFMKNLKGELVITGEDGDRFNFKEHKNTPGPELVKEEVLPGSYQRACRD